MAYEIVCDLRYTYFLRDATDKDTWTHLGPGAKRGMERLLHGEVISQKGSPPEVREEIRCFASGRNYCFQPGVQEIQHASILSAAGVDGLSGIGCIQIKVSSVLGLSVTTCRNFAPVALSFS